jgi:hypothetical protein
MNVALTRARHYLFVIARRMSIISNPYWNKLVDFATTKDALICVPMPEGGRRGRPNRLRSSLIKTSSQLRVTFGGVERRVYEVNSKASTSDDEDSDLFPDLTRIAPMHSAKAIIEDATIADGDCSGYL